MIRRVFDHRQAGVESSPGAIAAEEIDELAMPHAVVVFDALLEQTSVIGPFAEPLAALVFAECYVHDVGGANGDLIVTVVALDPT